MTVIKHNKEDFSLEVEKLAAISGIGFFDALLEVAESKELEMEVVPKLLTAKLKALLEEEASTLNLIRGEKKNKLPL